MMDICHKVKKIQFCSNINNCCLMETLLAVPFCGFLYTLYFESGFAVDFMQTEQKCNKHQMSFIKSENRNRKLGISFFP